MAAYEEVLLPWDSQPQEVSPLAEGGFDIAWVPSTALVVSDASVVPHPFGTAYKLAAGNSVELKKSTELLTTQGATVLLCGKSRTPSLGGEFGVLSASGGLGVRFGAHVPYTDGTVYFDFGGATTGTTRVLVSGLTFSENDVFIFSTGQRGMEIWQNGILRASNSANPTRTNDTNPWGLGAHATSPVGTKDSVWWLAAYASRQLPSSQIEEYGRQPFGIFAPQSIWVPVSAGAPAGISATLTQTLADATVSAASTLALKSTVSQTLAAATAASTGTVALKAATSSTFADATLVSTAALALKGTTTQTLADATLAATGSLQVAGSGVLAATLADASVASTATVALKATTAQTLAAATVAATSTVAVAGTLAKTLADATLSAQGTAQAVTTGSVAATLDNATVAAAAKLAISAYSAPTLADAALVATATMPLAGISAAMSVALGDATLASSATVLIKGSATISLGDCTIVAAGQDPATVTPTFTVISRRRIGGTPALNPGTRLGGATARSSSVRIGDKKP